MATDGIRRLDEGRPWLHVAVTAEVEPGESSDEDVALAASLGLPSGRAWAQLLTESAAPERAIAFSHDEIASNGGFPVDSGWQFDGRGRTVARVRNVASPDELDAVMSDLVLGGLPETRAAAMRQVLEGYLSDPSAVLLSSEDGRSRRVSALLAYSRDVTVLNGRIEYNVFPRGSVGVFGGKTRSALMACFALQSQADLETVVVGLARTGRLLPVSCTCHSSFDVTDDLAAEMKELVDYAQDMMEMTVELPDALDPEDLEVERATAFCM